MLSAYGLKHTRALDKHILFARPLVTHAESLLNVLGNMLSIIHPTYHRSGWMLYVNVCAKECNLMRYSRLKKYVFFRVVVDLCFLFRSSKRGYLK